MLEFGVHLVDGPATTEVIVSSFSVGHQGFCHFSLTTVLFCIEGHSDPYLSSLLKGESQNSKEELTIADCHQ